MKALSTTILIVVTAVVILVAALVLLTIFGGGIGTVSTLTNFRTQCATQCSITCKLGGSLPPTWSVQSTVQGQSRSCQIEFPNGCASAECGGVASSGGGIVTEKCGIGQNWCPSKNTCYSSDDFAKLCK